MMRQEESACSEGARLKAYLVFISALVVRVANAVANVVATTAVVVIIVATPAAVTAVKDIR